MIIGSHIDRACARLKADAWLGDSLIATLENTTMLHRSKRLLVALTLCLTVGCYAERTPSFPLLPEFTHTEPADWINSEPLSVSDLKGKVVLVDVWTFACWNCYRSFPWLNTLEETFASDPFIVIGVHSPEFEYEKERANIEIKVEEFKLKHPIMIDNDFSYWKALGNKYWPSFYLIDKQGKARGYWIGETHQGDKRAVAIEKAIRGLLAE
ncbi:MAG: redoxin family protein [Pseudomonadota bacterium]